MLHAKDGNSIASDVLFEIKGVLNAWIGGHSARRHSVNCTGPLDSTQCVLIAANIHHLRPIKPYKPYVKAAFVNRQSLVNIFKLFALM